MQRDLVQWLSENRKTLEGMARKFAAETANTAPVYDADDYVSEATKRLLKPGTWAGILASPQPQASALRNADQAMKDLRDKALREGDRRVELTEEALAEGEIIMAHQYRNDALHYGRLLCPERGRFMPKYGLGLMAYAGVEDECRAAPGDSFYVITRKEEDRGLFSHALAMKHHRSGETLDEVAYRLGIRGADPGRTVLRRLRKLSVHLKDD